MKVLKQTDLQELHDLDNMVVALERMKKSKVKKSAKQATTVSPDELIARIENVEETLRLLLKQRGQTN